MAQLHQHEHTLSSPLLPQTNQIPIPIYTNTDDNTESHNHIINIDSSHGEHPYKFLGIDEFHVSNSSTLTADPFRNHTRRIEGFYEWIKIVVLLPVALIRLVLFGLSLLVGYVATKIALFGWKDRLNPMPRWRSNIMFVTRLSTRCILFSFGYQWIKRKGRPASREKAPIVVSNHVSYIDPIFFFYELFPSIVASDSHDSMPCVGTIIRAMQVIYVNRFLPESRKNAIHEIKRKASCNRFPWVLLFPEGTTTNGKFLLSFQMGAFVPGFPIQPVIVRYPYVHFDQSWGNISLGRLMFRMFTQFHNFMEVEYLPVVSPLRNQKEDVSSFAERENPSRFMAELAHADLSSRISTTEALEFLEIFLSMRPDNSGCVKVDDFIGTLRIKRCDLSEKIFAFVDVEMKGKINFKQFLLASTHVMKQPLFQCACEYSFAKCSDDEHDYVCKEKFGEAINEAIPFAFPNDVDEVFNLFDVDGDGKVGKHDFLSCLRKNPLLIGLFSPLLQDEFQYTSNGLLELDETIC